MENTRIEDDHFQKWKAALEPLYGEREVQSMWRLYRESDRKDSDFEEDVVRLADHYPIQYLIGYTWFYGRKIYVNEHTLIPRPETEELVYALLERAGQLEETRLLDLGTGSGCIPVTIGMEQPGWDLTGVDISAEALEVARQNGACHQVDVRWEEADMLHWNQYTTLRERYDIIVSNPPYIPEKDRAIMASNVLQYEPDLALFTSDEGGLIFYREIANQAASILSAEGWIFLEVHEDHAVAVRELFSKKPEYSSIEVLRDMQGKERILVARKR